MSESIQQLQRAYTPSEFMIVVAARADRAEAGDEGGFGPGAGLHSG